MGFELEIDGYARQRRSGACDVDERIGALTRRWAAANERLRLAQVACHALRGHVQADDPLLIGAQLKLAQARYRRHEVDLEIGILERELELPEE